MVSYKWSYKPFLVTLLISSCITTHEPPSRAHSTIRGLDNYLYFFAEFLIISIDNPEFLIISIV